MVKNSIEVSGESWNRLLTRFFLLSYMVLIFFFQTACRKDSAPVKIIHVPGKAQKDPSRPNIIFFIADDVGYEVPTFTGGQSYYTPNLDLMAANGMQFTHFFGHPDGFPSRLALLTGKYNFRNYTHWGELTSSQKTIGNMLEDSGYATCFVGKWQCDGGNDGIHSHGFQDYSVYLPYISDGQRVGRYKNPQIYEDGRYVDRSDYRSYYSEDIFSDHLLNFIQYGDTARPFFGVYSFNLAAAPYVPSPDDPDYKHWDPRNDRANANTRYFPGMVAYMDKMIGKIIQGVKTYGVDSNTVFIFCTDNATTRDITSTWRGTTFTGSKTYTNWRGTLQPVVVYWPGKVSGGQVNDIIADYTDFLPTIADMAHIPRPLTYGMLDGVSFYDNLVNVPGQDREWSFTHWNNDNTDDDVVPAQRYVQDHNYKLYDTPDARFYDLAADRDEINNLLLGTLTPEQQSIKTQFEAILNEMHK